MIVARRRAPGARQNRPCSSQTVVSSSPRSRCGPAFPLVPIPVIGFVTNALTYHQSSIYMSDWREGGSPLETIKRSPAPAATAEIQRAVTRVTEFGGRRRGERDRTGQHHRPGNIVVATMVATTVDQIPRWASIVEGVSRASGEARSGAETMSKVAGVTVAPVRPPPTQRFRGYRHRRDRKPRSKHV